MLWVVLRPAQGTSGCALKTPPIFLLPFQVQPFQVWDLSCEKGSKVATESFHSLIFVYKYEFLNMI